MKRLLPLALLLCPGFLAAAPLTPEQALARIAKEGPAKSFGPATAMTLADTRSVDGTPAIYLFSGDDGFVVAAADDCVPALLGYGESCTVPTPSDNPNFNYWLDYMGRRVAIAAQTGYTPAPRQHEFDPIEPLCATMWNQSDPYNDLAPLDNGKKSVTGCVATGMAIMMKYHNWPDTGVGSLTYEWRNKPGQTITTDFTSYTFDWDNMLDVYNNSANAAQRKAVAELMRAAGGAVKMNYSSSASGAYSADIAWGLAKFLKYDKSLQYQMRDYYTLAQWENMIYASLTATGPVIYCGASASAGHCFICDGYSSNGYFHINWGWGGQSNGYFLLDALDPASQGIGGSSSGYNSNQDAVLYTKPDYDGTSEQAPPMMWWEYGMDVDYDTIIHPGQSGTVYSGFYNFGPFHILPGAVIQWRLTPIAGGDSVAFGQYVTPEDEELGIYYGWDQWEINVPEGLPEGSYKMWLEVARNAEGLFTRIPTQLSEAPYLLADVDRQGALTIRRLYIPRTEVNACSFATEVPVEHPDIPYSIAITNIGSEKLLSYTRIQMYKDGQLYASTDPEETLIAPGFSKDFSGTLSLTGITPEAGNYEIGFYAFNCNRKVNKNPDLSDLNGWLPLTDIYPVKITDSSGISVINPECAGETQWFDLEGRRVAKPSAPGFYIRKTSEGYKKVIL